MTSHLTTGQPTTSTTKTPTQIDPSPYQSPENFTPAPTTTRTAIPSPLTRSKKLTIPSIHHLSPRHQQRRVHPRPTTLHGVNIRNINDNNIPPLTTRRTSNSDTHSNLEKNIKDPPCALALVLILALILVRIYHYIKYRYIIARGNKLSLGVIHPMWTLLFLDTTH